MPSKILDPGELGDATCVVVGTRPGIIKMSPIIRELELRKLPFFVLHSGQHYSYEMDRVFFESLGLQEPKHQLPPCREGSLHGEQTAAMLTGIERVLAEEKPKIVLVCGDANTNLSGALAGRKLHIPVGHVEAGLRSFDWRMPEEHNRVIIDHISEYLFAPTERACENLRRDWVRGHIYLTYNTIVDAIRQHLEVARRTSSALTRLHLESGTYILMTLHREENVDDPGRLAKVLEGVAAVIQRHGYDIVWLCHPRTTQRLTNFGLQDRATAIQGLRIERSVGYLDFLVLQANAALVLTDSGGLQEESCALQIPCVTLRETTERPETVEVEANMLAGLETDAILAAVGRMLNRSRQWENPYGDGKAASRIVDAIVHDSPTLSEV